MKKQAAIIILFLSPLFLFAKDPKPNEQKSVQAIRAQNPIQINGILNEEVWLETGCSDFVQSDPIDGAQPSEKTEVWVAFDEEALYVAARLFDSQPELIMNRLGRRDDLVESDWFYFAVDPYFDRRTGFQFAVNPAGSFVDWTLYNDGWDDTTWDGVWECAANVDDRGWTVEIKIPFNQLRFPKKDEYVWGVNFRRVIKRKNERIDFVWIPKEDSGYVSHFAKLIGIRDIEPGRHIEFLPYAVGQARYSPKEQFNPFQTGKSYLGNTGFDFKLGLKSNLTLDATVNPDFGQVEVDPAVINLSAFETYFNEKRPFFIEGSNVFDEFGRGGSNMNANINWSAPSFFYSRRIGHPPQGYVTRDGSVNFPDRSTILGAFKLTGKIASGWSMGFINALTAREFAEIDSAGVRFEEEVEPFSYYGVLRAQKEFNQGAQGIGFLTTTVIRDLRKESLKDILNDKAFSLAMDGWAFLDKNRSWVINGWFGGTMVQGSPSAMYGLQHSSLHYYQRPDASYVDLNPEATSMSGWGGRFNLSKQKGNILLNLAVGLLSPGFDPNDAGFQFSSSDVINVHILSGYQQPQPGKLLRNWIVYGGPFRNYDFGGNKIWDGVLLAFESQFLNYWGVKTMLAYNPETISNRLTRGGPLALIPSGFQIDLGTYSDSRKPIVAAFESSLYSRPTEGIRWDGDLSLRWKPRSNMSFSFGPGYSFRRSRLQWITRVIDPLMADTYGTRYIFGRIEQRILSSNIRLNWIFTPKLSLQLYLQPFLAVGAYDEFKELAMPKSYEYNVFGDGESTIDFYNGRYTVDPDGPGPASDFSFPNPDFNLKSLRGTIVLRWEYMPGSTLYFVWTQNRADFSHPGDFNFGRDMSDLLTAPGDNIFLVKVSYRLNI